MSETENNDPLEINCTAVAGTKLSSNVSKASIDDIKIALSSVQDPELMLNIYELGLVYNIDQKEDGDVDIKMTLTSPTCPMGAEMVQMAAHAVSSVVGVGKVKVSLTFDPPWSTEMLSEEVKISMGIDTQ